MGKGILSKLAESGISFWSAMYIPIVVAMAAQQDVLAAITGGPLAIIAGIITVLVGFLFVPLISKIGNKKTYKDHAI
jgi:malonate transporter MadL subunit